MKLNKNKGFWEVVDSYGADTIKKALQIIFVNYPNNLNIY